MKCFTLDIKMKIQNYKKEIERRKTKKLIPSKTKQSEQELIIDEQNSAILTDESLIQNSAKGSGKYSLNSRSSKGELMPKKSSVSPVLKKKGSNRKAESRLSRSKNSKNVGTARMSLKSSISNSLQN